MMIKVALNGSYGNLAETKIVEEIIKNGTGSMIDRRIALAAKLEEVAVDEETVGVDNIVPYLLQHKDAVIRAIGKNSTEEELPSVTYYTWDRYLNNLHKTDVQTVDTSKKWGIEEYDGAEDIRCYEPKVIEEKYNFCTM